jgi:hypothetical protein
MPAESIVPGRDFRRPWRRLGRRIFNTEDDAEAVLMALRSGGQATS